MRTFTNRRIKSQLALAAATGVVALTLSSPPPASADDGTWTSTASGSWGDTANWSGGIVADGAGFAANFNTLDLTGDITVSLDQPRTLGSLNFSDTAPTTPGRWILSDGGNPANTLTLTANTQVSQGTVSLTGTLSTVGLFVSAGGTGNPNPVFSVDGGNVTASALSTINGGTAPGRFILTSGSAAFNAGLSTSNANGAIIRIEGGTLTASDLRVQRNSDAAPSFTSGIIVTGGTSTVGTVQLGSNNSSGAMSIEGGSFTATGPITIARQASGGRGGAMRVIGGTFDSTDATDGIILSRQDEGGNVNQIASATFSGGVSNVAKFTMGYDAAVNAGSATLTVNGGTLYVGGGGVVRNGTGAFTSTMSLSSGLLGANADWSSNVNVTLPAAGNINIKAADAANVPHNIALNGIVSGSGNINKTGGGTLTLNGVNTYTGSVTVTEGTLAGTTTGLRNNIANSGNVTFDQATDGTFTGVVSGAGSLSKTGSGSVTLSNPQTYTGATTVSGGTLAINGAQATSGVTVQNGAGLALAGNSTVNALTLGAAGGDAMTLRVNTGAGINSLGVLTTDALVAHGTTTIDVGSVGVAAGDYPVLDYAGTIGGSGGGFAAFTLGALPPRVTANLLDNTGNTSIDLQVTAVDFPRWTGAVNGDWDIGTLDLTTGTQNWKEVTSGNTTVYLQASVPGDQVLFDDTATGTTSINIVAPVSPALVTVNNPTLSYSFNGAAISGPTQLLKQGVGLLTVSNTGNDYTGGTSVQGGTLQYGAANALPTAGNVTVSGGTLQLSGLSQDLSGAFVLDGGTVDNGTVNKSGANYDLRSGTVSANLAGAVGINKTTAGTVVLTGTPTYTGATTVSEGTLQLGDGVTNGAVPGSITNSGTVAFNNGSDQFWTGNITGDAGSITKSGAGTLSVTGENQGNVTVNAGKIVAFGSTNNSRLARFGTLTINSGATVEVQGLNALGLSSGNNPPLTVLNAGGTLHGGATSDTALYAATFAGGTLSSEADAIWTLRDNYTAAAGTTSNVTAPTVNMANTPTFNVEAGANLNISGDVGGGSGLEKTGPGTMTLSGANNTYNAGTTVSAGTLQMSKMHGGVSISAGATLRVLESTPGLGSGHPAGDDAFVSRPTSLNIAAGATLDITNNDVIIDYTGSPTADYEALVRSAYNVVGDWAGPGITSSIAAADGNYIVAIADNALLAAPFGNLDGQGGPLFAGVDVDLSTILIKFTHRADINLDGLVTPDDSAVFGGNYDENQPAVWATGDMNYDGIFTPDDAAIFGGAYDESLSSLPEPGSLGVLALFGIGLARRRRSRHSQAL